MMSPIASAAVKAGIAAAAIVLVLARTRNLPRDEMGLVRPPLYPSLLIPALYLAWMFGTDAAMHWRGPWDFRPWLAAPLLASILRVAAVGILGPVAEELIFRGWFWGALRTRVGPALAIVVTAAGWAALHYEYGLAVLGVILVDGLLLGLARWRTGSVYPPIVMHILYNLYAVW
jgi:membrane protease YdiL (CAAX protease family)